MAKTMIPDPHTIARVAVEAQCDPRTAKAYYIEWLTGKPLTRPSIRARIESAIERIARGKVR